MDPAPEEPPPAPTPSPFRFRAGPCLGPRAPSHPSPQRSLEASLRFALPPSRFHPGSSIGSPCPLGGGGRGIIPRLFTVSPKAENYLKLAFYPPPHFSTFISQSDGTLPTPPPPLRNLGGWVSVTPPVFLKEA